MQRKKRKGKNPLLTRKINSKMRKKLVWLFGIVVLAFAGLSIRITVINASEGNQYKKQVLSQSQQKYDSRVIPFKRGDIKDRNGAVLATSEKVYKIILDCKVVNSKEDYIEPTIKAMVKVLGLDEAVIREKLESEETKASQYQIMQTNVSITKKKAFEDYTEMNDEEEKASLSEEEIKERNNVKGVWFEEDYLRTYPMGSLASHLIGFTYTGNTADWGIEGYYSSTLNGVNGRQYGYFNSDADVEQTIIEPVTGNSVISTIDVNIQQVVEKYIQEYMTQMADGPNGKKGAENVGVIVANPNNGEILAMATDSPFDLNDPRDLESFYSAEEIGAMSEEDMLDNLNGIWKNFCVSDAFEPGSTVKPMTVGAALQDHSILPSAEYDCDGYQMFGDDMIRCSVYPDEHGNQTLAQAMANSCNDAMMQIAEIQGAEGFLKYQKIFNLGSTTGIDLPGEAAGIIHSAENLSRQSTELASASFGQGYTCTMIQEMAALCSVINGGNYYRPHVVSRITDENGNLKENIEPVLMKQTVSADVSAQIREYMGAVMEKGGTGHAAKVDGYSMGGKTGTAQKLTLKDKKRQYLVSFIGFAPLDNPQVAVYVVVDEPNTSYQADSKYAQYIFKGIMTEILPYLNIFPDQELEEDRTSDFAYLESYIAQKAEENRLWRESHPQKDTTADTEEGSEDAGSEDTKEDGTTEDTEDTVDTEDTGDTEGTQDSGDTGDTEGGTLPSVDPFGENPIKEGADDPNLPAPPEDDSELDLNNKREDDGITNQDAGIGSGD